MKQKLDKLKINTKFNPKYQWFFLTILLSSLVFGIFFALFLKASDKELVKNYLEQFFSMIQNNKFPFFQTFLNTSVSFLFLCLIIWILGMSVLGLPVNIFLFFTKGFTLGFTLASLLINYKLKGLLFGAIYLIPELIFLFLLLFLLYYACHLSFKIFQSVMKKKVIDFKPIRNKYLSILCIVLLFGIANSFFSCLIDQYLLKFLFTLIK